MAVYIPAGRGRRRAVVVVIVASVVSLALGFVVGRGTAEGVDDAVATSQDLARDAATALARLPFEYEQAASGAGENRETIARSVDAAINRLGEAYRAAPWLSRRVRQPAEDATATVRSDVRDGASTSTFQDDIDAATAAIAALFDIEVPRDLT